MLFYITIPFLIISAFVFAYRIAKLSTKYVKTGKLGDEENNLAFAFFEPPKLFELEAWLNFLVETHPLALFLDFLFLSIIYLIIWLFVLMPQFFVLTVITIAFVITLRKLRAREAEKQEFMEKLKGG